MNTANVLTAEKVAELKKRGIDFSDIPEMTDEEASKLYPKN